MWEYIHNCVFFFQIILANKMEKKAYSFIDLVVFFNYFVYELCVSMNKIWIYRFSNHIFFSFNQI